jgi:hypothetical protein
VSPWEPGAARDPLLTLAWACVAVGLAIAILGSGSVIVENRGIDTVPRASWASPDADGRLPVWPFFYSGTGVVAYGVLLLAMGRREDGKLGEVPEGANPRGTRAG